MEGLASFWTLTMKVFWSKLEAEEAKENNEKKKKRKKPIGGEENKEQKKEKGLSIEVRCVNGNVDQNLHKKERYLNCVAAVAWTGM